MANPFTDPLHRASDYATQRGILLKQSLGYGKDGSVFATDAATAVKVFRSTTCFDSELACYLRLRELDVRQVIGHAVPRLVSFDDHLLAIEMTIVQPPYILDFASSRLDFPPDFSDEILAQWESDRREEFGPHWPHVRLLVHLFAENFGIYLLDVHPRNITFPPP